MKKVAVLGAGLSGLTVAYLLKKKGCDVTVFEATSHIGGALKTLQEPVDRADDFKNSFTVELGPNGWLNNAPRTLELIEDLKLASEIISASETSNRRFFYIGGQLKEVPTNPILFLKSDLFTWPEKFQLLFKILKMRFFPKPFTQSLSIFETFKSLFGEKAASLARIAMLCIYAGEAHILSFP